MTRSRPLAAALLAAAVGTLAAQDVRPAGDARAFDKAVVDALRDAHNRGADLYNQAKDFGGAYRLYQGSLTAVRPLLAHRPDAVKLIDDGVAESEKEADVAVKAFKLHEAIEKVRAHLKAAPALPDPAVEAAKKAAAEATAAAEKKAAESIKAAEAKLATAAAEAKKLADGLKAAEKKAADAADGLKAAEKKAADAMKAVDKKSTDEKAETKKLTDALAAADKKLTDAAAAAKKLTDDKAAAEKKLAEAEAAVKKLTDEKAALEKKLADAAKSPPKATPPAAKTEPAPKKAPPTGKSSAAPATAAGPAGTVAVKGAPLESGEVVFVSLTLPTPRVFVAVVANGKYAVATAVPDGTYVVAVTGKGVPEKYTTTTTSGLRADVKAGGPFDFILM